MLNRIAASINLLGAFCGMRDIPELSRSFLSGKYSIDQANVMVLFGGSILAGGDLLAQAMRENIAKKYIVVGGEGHTTQTLRDKVHALYPDFSTDSLPEAEVFSGYLLRKYNLRPDLLECASTNCGNNITNLLSLLKENSIDFSTIILSQDASMQRRMDAGLRKHAPNVQIINYAAYAAEVIAQNNALTFSQAIPGMWTIERYASLLLGEIPRLSDDAEGYGPRGKGYIAHVDIPDEVRAAFNFLAKLNPGLIRAADPKYAG